MGLTEEIGSLLQQGKSEQEAVMTLQQQGYGMREISEALAQSKIKLAVSESVQEYGENIEQPHQTSDFSPYGQGMQQSVMSAVQKPSTQELAPQDNPSEQSGFAQYQQFQKQYADSLQSQPAQQPQQEYYQQYDSSNANADVISEIAEQVVTQKLSGLRSSLEAVYNLKNSLETKMETLDERLKRIEKIIDRLQLSVLQKVGDYMTNVEDIKKELIETQKTFKAIMSQSRPSQSG